MGDVIQLPTRGDIESKLIFEGAIKADLKEAFVCGWTADGTLYIASSNGYVPDLLFLIEHAKRAVMDHSD